MNDETQQVESKVALSPGAELRKAREKAGYSLQDISNTTRITVSRLSALEEDDFDNAGAAPPFVLGYVRAYAKVVGIPSEPLIAALEDYVVAATSDDELENMDDDKPMTMNSSKGGSGKILFILILLVVVGFGVWLFLANDSSNAVPKPSGGDENEGGLSTSSLPVDIESSSPPEQSDQGVTSNSRVSEVVAVTSESPAEITARTAANSPSNANTQTHADVNVVESSAASGGDLTEDSSAEDRLEEDRLIEGDEIIESVSGDASLDGQAADLASESDEGFTLASSEEQDTIRLVLSEDCWIEVVDANEDAVLTVLGREGQTLLAKGQAPFDLKLGNVYAAAVYVNDRLLDLQPRPGRKTLRIQVGP